MKEIKKMFLIFLVFVFFLGLYVTMYFDKNKSVEQMEEKKDKDSDEESCPDLLIQKGNVLMLYNTKLPTVEGKNPIPFFNLDEYINYLEIQKKKGKNCPVLYLQQENNAQGEDVYRMRPSPFELQPGLPKTTNVNEDGHVAKIVDASRESKLYNQNQYPGFDPTSQYQGVYTNIDAVHDSTGKNKISDNPMDANWAGTTYTQQMVESGKYDENNITNPVLFQPKTAFYPSIGSNDIKRPVDVL
jgi:hypothetical protein